jgi:hypothetical protein
MWLPEMQAMDREVSTLTANQSKKPGTRIFSSRIHPTPSVAIGLHLNQFHQLLPFSTLPFSRFNPIIPDSSEKVQRKSPGSDRFGFFSPTLARSPARGLLMIGLRPTDQKAKPFFLLSLGILPATGIPLATINAVRLPRSKTPDPGVTPIDRRSLRAGRCPVVSTPKRKETVMSDSRFPGTKTQTKGR